MSTSILTDLKANSLRLTEANSSSLAELAVLSGLITMYNGSNRIMITPTTFSSDGILNVSNANLSGTSTGVAQLSSDNSSKLATTSFVKSQTIDLTGYVQTNVSQTWTATQNFSTITASTPATSDNSSKVATTAYVKAQPAGLTLPIVLGSTGTILQLGQSILYSTTYVNKTINSTARVFAPSGLLAPGSYVAHVTAYAYPASYTIAVYGVASSATQMTDNQTTGLDYDTYSVRQEINNVNITNGLLFASVCTVIDIVTSRPYVSAYVYMSGSTNGGWIQLKLTRIA